jgi:microcin C transport system permease protein
MDASGNPTIYEPTAAPQQPSRLRMWLARTFKFNPINRRRWENFKSNRRAYISLWLFLGVFGLSLISEFIANDKPLLVRYKGEWLSPVLVNYPEEKFGGFLAITDYKDPVIYDEIKAHGWMLWPPIRYSYSSINKDYPRVKTDAGLCLGFPAPPPWSTRQAYCDAPADQVQRYETFGNRNWLGTDDQGRDLVARLLYGLRISVLFGLLLTTLGSIVGIAAGAVQGYFGGKVDLIFQRFLEIWSSVPVFFVLIIISSVLAPSFWTLLGILLLFEWVGLVGVVRAEFLRGRNLEYVTAARALGLSDAKIMFKHILPNAMVATLTFLPFKLTSAITALTALDFLGLGLPPGSPSLGELLTQAKSNLQAPWIAFAAFFSLAGLLSLLIFIGEGARDALDPRKTFR